jgi:hypothetical protein
MPSWVRRLLAHRLRSLPVFTFFRQHATGRHVLISLAVVAVLAALSHVLLVPAYREAAAGFVPLDMQYPLTPFMIAIQRGAFDIAVHGAYLRFACLNIIFAMTFAVFLCLLWSWLAAQVPNTFAPHALNYGLLLLPPVQALVSVADTVCLAQLVFAESHDPLHALTDATLQVHRVRYLLTTVTDAVTLGLVALVVIIRFRGRGQDL